MKNGYKLWMGSMVLLFLTSCGPTTPEQPVWQPWTRTLDDGELPQPPADFEIKAEGNTEVLLGSERLLQSNLKTITAELLYRRGYQITDSNPAYTLKLHYETKEEAYTDTYIRTSQAAATGMSGSVGVFAASQVAAQATESDTEIMEQEQTGYRHTLALEIVDNSYEELKWKGETSWFSESKELDMEFYQPVQLLLSDLPNEEVTPTVERVKTERAETYSELRLVGRRFSGPAVPYPVRFADITEPTGMQSRAEQFLDNVSNPEALQAYVDLIRTAEYALLVDPDYEQPLDRDNWASVQLGGTYNIGDDTEESRILIDLRGSEEGYYVDDARIVDEQEFRAFQEGLEQWQDALRSYFDIYE